MDNKKIDLKLFQRKMKNIDFKTLELKPQTVLNFCRAPPQPEKYEPQIDMRYLENDSRYISPEDLQKYEKEFYEIKRNDELKSLEYIAKQYFIEKNIINEDENIDEYESEDNFNVEDEQVSDYDECEEYEFRSSKN